MDRAELEHLDREGLVLRAQAAGIRRARLLTRPELVDELLRLDPVIDASQLKRTRGFFGRARDLLSRVVERGLHLPDAADRLRLALGDPLPEVPRPEPQAVPTVTLAEIYAAQGHKQRAIETLRRVLEAEPDHGAARVLLEKLEDASYVPPSPPLPPEPEVEPVAEAEDDDPEPDTEQPETRQPETQQPATELYVRAVPDPPMTPEPVTARGFEAGIAQAPEAGPVSSATARATDECVAIPVHASATYVWWRLSLASRRLAEESFFFVRVVVFVPHWDGPRSVTRDLAADPGAGELVLHDLPPNAIVRVAVGFTQSGAFVPVAHSPAIEVIGNGQLVHWTVEGRHPIVFEDPSAAAIAAAAKRAMEMSSTE